MSGQPIDEELSKHRAIVDPVGVISEIISNISDQRNAIRELLSNAAAREVGAKHVATRVYESDKGLSFSVEDDGCGMDYTNDAGKPGRLDKFLNIAQGKQAGFASDEFGTKGLGTILLYNSRRVEVETWDGGENYFRVVLEEPRTHIIDRKDLPEPLVYRTRAAFDPMRKRGTRVKVLGWNELDFIPKQFKIEELERYLRYYTVVGYTRADSRETPLPEFTLSVGAQSRQLKPGFPFIVADEKAEDARTVTVGPIRVSGKTPKGTSVAAVIKGGATIDTAKFDLTDQTGGVWVSVQGIPYFKLSGWWVRRLNLTDDFVRFVVECDDVRLNLSRGDFNYDEIYDVFENALRDGFDQIRNDRKFQMFYRNKYRESRIGLQQYMSRKKEEFLSPEKRLVWVQGRSLIGEPESEQDVGALLWILEGLGALPFAHFRTLQYPGYREGVDLLVDFQEEKESEKHYCAYVELEKMFSSLIRQKHDISQMSFAFCWKVDKPRVTVGQIQPTKKPYKHIYTLSDSHVSVFEISSFPTIFVGTKREAEEHYANYSTVR